MDAEKGEKERQLRSDTDPSNIHELANVAREIGAEVIGGTVSYPSEITGWQIGDVNFCETLEQYRRRRVQVNMDDQQAVDKHPE